MKIRFYLDPKTNTSYIHRHKVTAQEVEDVLSHPGEDRIGTRGYELPLVRPDPAGTFASSMCQNQRVYL